ncbi:hypothetical protein [Geothermobacter hydrogeniphilus]|uniref:hypothetical protein n=1 Tax=Geothermobacter hydrogeniphilus TaxID=1969733 RepID=UPI0018EBD5E4|nr:hypothetical protein [Geothermobacter hydrogeniphilus]
MTQLWKIWLGQTFAAVFLGLALLLIGLAGFQFWNGILAGHELISILVRALNTAIIALAIFELGIGISHEYAVPHNSRHTFSIIRRQLTRFVGTVCVALVLEGLIMVIKYSQLDLAGNLYYPVAILVGASVLLSSLGLFLHLSRDDVERQQSSGQGNAHPTLRSAQHRNRGLKQLQKK